MSDAVHPTIAMLRSSSLMDIVLKEIESAIMAGTYPPGSKLVEATLAASLGVSRGPVREAFRVLEEAGLLRNEKNRGVFVRSIPIEEAMEIFDLRAAMEALVGRQVAETATKEQVAALRTLVSDMEKAVRAENPGKYHLLNLEFHDSLVDIAGNQKLKSIYRKLTRELSLFRRLNLAGGAVMPASASEHRQIMDAIAAHDPDAASHALFTHVMESKERALENHLRRAEPEPAKPVRARKAPSAKTAAAKRVARAA